MFPGGRCRVFDVLAGEALAVVNLIKEKGRKRVVDGRIKTKRQPHISGRKERRQ
jgi:hypothetical protein